jgi:hypothetical protein
VTGQLAGKRPDYRPVPRTLQRAYQAWFDCYWPQEAAAARAVAELLRLLVTSREPPSLSLLDALGMRAVLPALPGWGVLFQERECVPPVPLFCCPHAAPAARAHRPAPAASRCTHLQRSVAPPPFMHTGEHQPWR